MNEEVIINTERLSNEEKRVLESTFAFECCTGYNLTGAKQYKIPKEQLVKEIENSLALLDKKTFEIEKNNMMRQVISASSIVFATGLIATMISIPFLVIPPAIILCIVDLFINKRITDRKMEKINISKKARKMLLAKIEEDSLREALQAKVVLQEQEEKTENKEQEKGNISLDITASSDVIGKAGNQVQNISNTEVSVKIETIAKEAEPKKMVKERNK